MCGKGLVTSFAEPSHRSMGPVGKKLWRKDFMKNLNSEKTILLVLKLLIALVFAFLFLLVHGNFISI
jgi:hypothetical protein